MTPMGILVGCPQSEGNRPLRNLRGLIMWIAFSLVVCVVSYLSWCRLQRHWTPEDEFGLFYSTVWFSDGNTGTRVRLNAPTWKIGGVVKKYESASSAPFTRDATDVRKAHGLVATFHGSTFIRVYIPASHPNYSEIEDQKVNKLQNMFA